MIFHAILNRSIPAGSPVGWQACINEVQDAEVSWHYLLCTLGCNWDSTPPSLSATFDGEDLDARCLYT